MDHQHTNKTLKRPLLKYYTLITGSMSGHEASIERDLKKQIPGLQKVQKLEECDFILVFCPVVSRAGTNLDAAVKRLSTQPGNKPAVLLVLHHTFDAECVVPDSSRAVTRENAITVDCLFYEDQGLLPCSQNKQAMIKVANWIIPKENSSGNQIPRSRFYTEEEPYGKGLMIPPVRRGMKMKEAIFYTPSGKQKVFPPVRKYFTITTANTPRQYKTIERKLQATACLEKECTAATCDFFLVFCTGNGIEEDQCKFISKSDDMRPAVLVVLHQPVYTVPDNSSTVDRGSTITIDCLFCEDQGLIQCPRNSEALSTVGNWLPKGNWNGGSSPSKYFTITTKNTPTHYQAIEKLHEVFPHLREVHAAELCDFILVFCAASDIPAVPEMLALQPANKSAVIMVLHTECTVLDYTGAGSSQGVNRDKTLRVDCFISENEELLPCSENKKALSEIVSWLSREEETNPPKVICKEIKSPAPYIPCAIGKTTEVKYLTCLGGITLNAHVEFLRNLSQRVSGLQEVRSVEQCDVILLFSPVVSRAETDIQAALKKLTDLHVSKPAVLIVLHHTFDTEFVVPDSSIAVNKYNITAVDCLFHEDQGLLQCTKNNEAYTQVSRWIEAQRKSKNLKTY